MAVQIIQNSSSKTSSIEKQHIIVEKRYFRAQCGMLDLPPSPLKTHGYRSNTLEDSYLYIDTSTTIIFLALLLRVIIFLS